MPCDQVDYVDLNILIQDIKPVLHGKGKFKTGILLCTYVAVTRDYVWVEFFKFRILVLKRNPEYQYFSYLLDTYR